jgi:hypothetical protein
MSLCNPLAENLPKADRFGGLPFVFVMQLKARGVGVRYYINEKHAVMAESLAAVRLKAIFTT